MKVCGKCGAENANSSYMCEKCGERLSAREDSNNVEYIERIERFTKSNESVFDTDNNKKSILTLGKIVIIIIAYIIYILLAGIMPGPLVIADIICGWCFLSGIDKDAGLPGATGLLVLLETGCVGCLVMFVLSFFIGLFFLPAIVGGKIYNLFFANRD